MKCSFSVVTSGLTAYADYLEGRVRGPEGVLSADEAGALTKHVPALRTAAGLTKAVTGTLRAASAVAKSAVYFQDAVNNFISGVNDVTLDLLAAPAPTPVAPVAPVADGSTDHPYPLPETDCDAAHDQTWGQFANDPDHLLMLCIAGDFGGWVPPEDDPASYGQPLGAQVPIAACISLHDMHAGMKGDRDQIELLQIALSQYFYTGEVDGYFGPNTLNAAIKESIANADPYGPREFSLDGTTIFANQFQRLGLACGHNRQASPPLCPCQPQPGSNTARSLASHHRHGEPRLT